MAADDWNEESRRALGMWLHGEQIPETDERGQPLADASFLVLFNADHEPVEFKLPDAGPGVTWTVEVDTATADGDPPRDAPAPNGAYKLEGRALALLRQGDGSVS
jgi:glycogen operon protein